MNSIEELPFKTVNLIKSSQVITSLSSIVKELLENSIDAGATVISIILNGYGFSKLEVKDNGSGISDSDIEYVAKPHYTSKIKSFEDLDKLVTYGFRGEAISSLCSVADISITTRIKGSSVGNTYKFDHHGNIEEKVSTAANQGTAIVIRNLFNNIPVRKQYFLQAKRCRDELKKVEELAMSYAIIQPKLHLSVVHDSYKILQKPSCEEIAQVFYSVFQNATKKLSNKAYECQKFKILLWLPDKTCLKESSFSRSSTDRLFIFVNSRPITHKPIEKIIKAYYCQQLTGSHGRYPIGVFCLEISSDSIDVNLEPNKTRVLFKDEVSILNALEELLIDFYGKIECKDNIGYESKNITERMESLPCTLADVSQKENGVNDHADLSQKEKSVNGFADSSQKENKVDDIYSQYKCIVESKIKNMLSSTQKFYDSDAMPEDISNFELGSLSTINGTPPSLQHTNSQNSNISVESSICTEGPKTDLDSETPKEITCVNNSKRAHKSMIGTDGVPVYVIPAFLDEESGNNRDDVQSKLNQCQDTNVRNMLNLSSEVSVNQRVKDNDCEIPDLLGNAQLGNIELSSNSNKLTLNDSPGVKQNINLSDSLFLEKSSNDEVQIGTLVSNLDSFPIQQPQQPKRDTCHKVSLEEQSNSVFHFEKLLLTKSEKDCDIIKSKQHISIGDDCWSRGHVQLDNKTIQNVNILTPPTTFYKKENLNNFKSMDTKNVPKRKLSELDFGKVAACKVAKKKDIFEIDESINYSSPVAKIETAFSLFAKDIRKIVLEENPGTNFTVVAQEIATRWKEADTEVKTRYEDKAKYILKTLSKVKPRQSATPTTPILKKDRLKTLSKTKSFSNTPPKEKPWLKRQMFINFSFEDIKTKLLADKNKKSCENNQNDRIIGHINGTNGWIYCLKNKICCFNSSRLSEVLLYKTLLGSFSVPAPDLVIPIPFDASSLGDMEWQTLIQLNHTKSHSEASNLICDKRILANGFKISLLTDDSGLITHGQITGMIDCLQNYGLQDLGNICKKLNEDSSSSLEETRPPTIQNWLKEEAIRMAKCSPHFRDRTVVNEKISVWQELTDNVDKHSARCLHEKLIFTPLVSVVIEEEEI